MTTLLNHLINKVNTDAFDVPAMLQEILQRYIDCLQSICLPQLRVTPGSLSATLLAHQISRYGGCFRNISLLLPFFDQSRITAVLWSHLKVAIESVLRLANAEEVSLMCAPTLLLSIFIQGIECIIQLCRGYVASFPLQPLAAKALGEAGEASITLRAMLAQLEMIEQADVKYKLLRDSLRELNQ